MFDVIFFNQNKTVQLNKDEILDKTLDEFISLLSTKFESTSENQKFVVFNESLYRKGENLNLKQIFDEQKNLINNIIYVETTDKNFYLIKHDEIFPGLALNATEPQLTIIRSINHIKSFLDNYNDELYSQIINLVPYEELGSDPEKNLEILTKWFKEEFFVFVRGLKCKNCQGDSDVVGATYPTSYERDGLCNNTEIHVCKNCKSSQRFPRYDSVPRLLETRCGRCAEFANTFTAILLALDFDARVVLDLTDHLWTEVWIPSKNKYVHIDSCENIIDAPYVYETGWGKKLNWIFSFGKHDILDVTKKYTKNYDDVLKRRSNVDEQWLEKLIITRRNAYRAGLSEKENRVLDYKNLMDILSMESHRDENKPEELNDRISGSI